MHYLALALKLLFERNSLRLLTICYTCLHPAAVLIFPVVQEFICSYWGSIFKTTKCAIKYCLVLAGWDVENGPLDQDNSLKPAMLISLSAPKLYSIYFMFIFSLSSKIIEVDYGRCARFFHGIHYLGGRFIAPTLATKYKLKLPNYPSTHNCVRL
jgi:hypothetical protein